MLICGKLIMNLWGAPEREPEEIGNLCFYRSSRFVVRETAPDQVGTMNHMGNFSYFQI